jgi:predicted acetyltransferase
MVARCAQPPGPSVIDYRMAEFFICGTSRRLGIGRTAVNLILNRFAGRWEITEYLRIPVLSVSGGGWWRPTRVAATRKE